MPSLCFIKHYKDEIITLVLQFWSFFYFSICITNIGFIYVIVKWISNCTDMYISWYANL